MSEFEKAYYEFENFWNSETFNNSNLERIKATYALIPSDANSILDVACGNGLFCNYIASERSSMRVMGLDRSNTALSHVRTEKVQGEIISLPFDNREFDCVSALQVLEHLAVPDYQRAKSEIARVASKYVVVSVPYKQCLEDEYTRCPSCRTIFNYDLHLRSFDDRDSAELLLNEGFVCVNQIKFGKRIEYVGRKQYYNLFFPENKYRWNSPICPLCGYEDENFLKKIEDSNSSVQLKKSLLQYLTKLPKRIWPKLSRDYWIISLYERKSQ